MKRRELGEVAFFDLELFRVGCSLDASYRVVNCLAIGRHKGIIEYENEVVSLVVWVLKGGGSWVKLVSSWLSQVLKSSGVLQFPIAYFWSALGCNM